MTDNELVEYYKRLLIIQYRGKPRAEATVRAAVGVLVIRGLLEAVKRGFNIDTAAGKQLDVLAKYAGVRRQITGIDFSRRFFGYILYDHPDPPYQWSRYNSYDNPIPNTTDYYSYDEDQSELYLLNDAELRLFIQFGIFRNCRVSSLKEIDTFLAGVMPAVTAEEIDVMQIEFIAPESETLFPILEHENLLPRSAAEKTIFVYM